MAVFDERPAASPVGTFGAHGGSRARRRRSGRERREDRFAGVRAVAGRDQRARPVRTGGQRARPGPGACRLVRVRVGERFAGLAEGVRRDRDLRTFSSRNLPVLAHVARFSDGRFPGVAFSPLLTCGARGLDIRPVGIWHSKTVQHALFLANSDSKMYEDALGLRGWVNLCLSGNILAMWALPPFCGEPHVRNPPSWIPARLTATVAALRNSTHCGQMERPDGDGTKSSRAPFTSVSECCLSTALFAPPPIRPQQRS